MPTDTTRAASREETTMTPTEAREYVMAAPDPMDGPPIWGRPGMRDKGDPTGMSDGYDMSARAAAKAMLIVSEEDRSLLDVPSREDDPSGIERAFADEHWKAAAARWPGLDNWLGGISGFQFGWANNIVRYILDAEQVGNPAILTVGSK